MEKEVYESPQISLLEMDLDGVVMTGSGGRSDYGEREDI